MDLRDGWECQLFGVLRLTSEALPASVEKLAVDAATGEQAARLAEGKKLSSKRKENVVCPLHRCETAIHSSRFHVQQSDGDG